VGVFSEHSVVSANQRLFGNLADVLRSGRETKGRVGEIAM